MSLRTRMTRLPRRRPLHLGAVLLFAFGAVVGPAGPAAQAAVATITCVGTSPTTFAPGLTFTTQSITYTETDDYSTCVSTDPTLASGISVNTATGDASCVSLPAVSPVGPYTVTWNNGQTSTFALSYVVTVVAGVSNVTGTGTVTSGELTGATGVFVWVYTAPNPLDCLTTTGVTSENGPLTATITSA
jgi:hypothetical protein